MSKARRRVAYGHQPQESRIAKRISTSLQPTPPSANRRRGGNRFALSGPASVGGRVPRSRAGSAQGRRTGTERKGGWGSTAPGYGYGGHGKDPASVRRYQSSGRRPTRVRRFARHCRPGGGG